MAALCVAAIGATGCGQGDRSRSIALEVGQTVGGRLEQSDWTDVFADGSYTDLYHVRLEAGQQVTIELRSSDFDTYVAVMRGPGDVLVDNDDITEGGSDTNSRLSYRAQTTGLYYVAATTFRQGATGAYTLSIARSTPGTPVTQPTTQPPPAATSEKTGS
jgi:hypothetical protein